MINTLEYTETPLTMATREPARINVSHGDQYL